MNEDEQAIDGLNAERKALGLSEIPTKKNQNETRSEKDEETESDSPSIDNELPPVFDKGSDEDESDEEESEEDTEDETEDESDDEDEDEEEADDDEEESKDETTHRKPRRYIPVKQYKSEKAEERVERQKLLDTITSLQTELGEAKENPGKDKASSKIDQIAEELGIEDPQNFKKILEALKAEVIEEFSGNIPTDIKKRLDAVESTFKANQDEQKKQSDDAFFNKSWDHLAKGDFASMFPNATDEQKTQAKTLLDEIWHTEKWHDKDAEYVFFKNRDKFSTIVSPRRRGLETGRPQGHVSAKGRKMKLSDNPSEEELREMDRTLSEISSAGSSLQDVTTTMI